MSLLLVLCLAYGASVVLTFAFLACAPVVTEEEFAEEEKYALPLAQ